MVLSVPAKKVVVLAPTSPSPDSEEGLEGKRRE